ncbi:hypothetical protein GUJ93_ZPchr0002g24104 [Zizania palustris]|uniref:t-SNARE coiled-coil homology domain-containing protein n=1 Tax=Zizania palustris TaxID=103762 RepID=A0A8J5S946_ZIZPA|nr:hypothetical protein GUJ93_ZPchr0002g24104 [Zizania palustris]
MSGRTSFFASRKKAADRRGPSQNKNPFDSDSDDGGREARPARASSVPPPADQRGSLLGSGAGAEGFSSSSAAARSRYRNDFRDAGGVEAQSVQELEGYAAYKAEDTTQRVQGCVRIAEEMRETASKSLVTVHQQGQQITRTHMMAVDIDQDLSRSEKLLGDLGGIFSKKWKPKKNGEIRGPMLTRDDSFIRKGSHSEQRQKLGLSDHPPRSDARQFNSVPTSALQKVEVEKAKQDDALSDLSNILTELKGMAVDIGSEIDRQTKSLGDSEKDFDELNFRIKGANTRTPSHAEPPPPSPPSGRAPRAAEPPPPSPPSGRAPAAEPPERPSPRIRAPRAAEPPSPDAEAPPPDAEAPAAGPSAGRRGPRRWTFRRTPSPRRRTPRPPPPEAEAPAAGGRTFRR